MDVVIASGKGGTGKTMISVALAEHVAASGTGVALLDCDVEEPNANLFMNVPVTSEEPATVPIPEVDMELCTGCGECERICRYNAIPVIKGTPLVLPELCHGCGGCTMICPEGAIKEIRREIGVVEEGARGNLRYAGGRLNVGEAMSPPLIKAVKGRHHGSALRVIDAPPGTSCPAMAAANGAAYAILVAEPTPFGVNDFILAARMVKLLEIPMGVVINKDGCGETGDSGIGTYCAGENIEVIARIPHSWELAVAYSENRLAGYLAEHFQDTIKRIADTVFSETAGSR